MNVLRWWAVVLVLVQSLAIVGKARAEAEVAATFMEVSPYSGFVVSSPATQSELALHLSSWLLMEFSEVEGDEDFRVRVPRTRLVLAGRYFDGKLRSFVQPELAGPGAHLLDVFVDVELPLGAVLRFGQFRTPYARSFINPIIKLTLPDRGIVSDSFRLGRDTGAMLYGEVGDGTLEYYAGLFNGASINTLDGNLAEPMPVVRLVYNVGNPVAYDQSPSASSPVEGGVAIGINGAFRRREIVLDPTMGVTADVDAWHLGADFALASGPASVVAEGYMRFEQQNRGGSWQKDYGAFLQCGWFAVPKQLELATRVGWMVAASLERQDLEVGANHYWQHGSKALGHHLKGSLRYVLSRRENSMVGGDANHHILQAQGQLWF